MRDEDLSDDRFEGDGERFLVSTMDSNDFSSTTRFEGDSDRLDDVLVSEKDDFVLSVTFAAGLGGLVLSLSMVSVRCSSTTPARVGETFFDSLGRSAFSALLLEVTVSETLSRSTDVLVGDGDDFEDTTSVFPSEIFLEVDADRLLEAETAEKLSSERTSVCSRDGEYDFFASDTFVSED